MMIKRVLLILGFYLFLMSANIAHSHSMDITELQNVLSNLIIWLENQKNIKYENISRPSIKIVNIKEMCSIAYGDKRRNLNYQKQCNKIMGLYDYHNKTIHITHDVDLSSVEGQAIILHELVHHFQYESGKADKVNKINQLENLAYFLEKKFIKENPLFAAK